MADKERRADMLIPNPPGGLSVIHRKVEERVGYSLSSAKRLRQKVKSAVPVSASSLI